MVALFQSGRNPVNWFLLAGFVYHKITFPSIFFDGSLKSYQSTVVQKGEGREKNSNLIQQQELLQTPAGAIGRGQVEISNRGNKQRVQKKRKPGWKPVVTANGQNMSARPISFPLLRIFFFFLGGGGGR